MKQWLSKGPNPFPKVHERLRTSQALVVVPILVVGVVVVAAVVVVLVRSVVPHEIKWN